MLASLTRSSQETWRAFRRRWPYWTAGALVGAVVAFAIMLSDDQGRMDLPLAYAVRMTCEEDPEADLWRGGCERIATDIARSDHPGFGELYRAFALVHHAPRPRDAQAAQFARADPEPGFDLDALLKGQRYGLALVTPEFEGVRSRAHAEAVMADIDARDKALLVIGRAGLGYDALIAGALANLVHPGALLDGARQYAAILTGRAKTSDFATGTSPRP